MEPVRLRAQVVMGIFAAMVCISALGVVLDQAVRQYIHEGSSSGFLDPARGERLDELESTLRAVQLGLTLGSVIAFLVWFHRVHKNLKSGGLSGLEFSPRWAVGGFFVPFLNLYRPWQVMREVWMGSAHLSGEAEEDSWQEVTPSQYVVWWWLLFCAYSLLERFAGRVLSRAEDLADLQFGWLVTMACDLVGIPAALVALLLVRRVTGLQEEAIARREDGAPVAAD